MTLNPTPLMFRKLGVSFLFLLLAGCYLPTRDRLCRDLHSSPGRCRGEGALRNRFLDAYPLGMSLAVARRNLQTEFVARDPLTQLHDRNDGLELLASYDVQGFAACKEHIVIRFEAAGDVLTDINVDIGQTCL